MKKNITIDASNKVIKNFQRKLKREEEIKKKLQKQTNFNNLPIADLDISEFLPQSCNLPHELFKSNTEKQSQNNIYSVNNTVNNTIQSKQNVILPKPKSNFKPNQPTNFPKTNNMPKPYTIIKPEIVTMPTVRQKVSKSQQLNNKYKKPSYYPTVDLSEDVDIELQTKIAIPDLSLKQKNETQIKQAYYKKEIEIEQLKKHILSLEKRNSHLKHHLNKIKQKKNSSLNRTIPEPSVNIDTNSIPVNNHKEVKSIQKKNDIDNNSIQSNLSQNIQTLLKKEKIVENDECFTDNTPESVLIDIYRFGRDFQIKQKNL